jgi:RNA polymerase-binding transcription factor DksA
VPRCGDGPSGGARCRAALPARILLSSDDMSRLRESESSVPAPSPSEEATVSQFLAALERVERGTFGLCVACEQPIERARIEASPLVERCAPCERNARHPWLAA